ncbi:MAG TPA: PQQ-binding-like beta-propeller repeat protein [Gemmatimonadales bacterium]|nr:PQQ-binding-like beta-propeller repeat protein [Gemmatimonadales bacterium]
MSLALLLVSVNAGCVNFRPPPKPVAAGLAGDAPAQVWTVRAGNRFTGRVEIAGNTLYGGSIDRKVYAVDLSSGDVRWSRRLSGMIVGGVLLAGDTVFAASSRPEGRVYALRRSNGKQIWRTSTPAVGAPLALVAGILIAQTQRGEVIGLHPQNGKILWRRRLGVGRIPAARAGEAAVLIATTDSLFRLNAKDGRVTHRAASPGAVVSPWLTQEDALVGGTTDSQVVSIRPENLRRNWSFRVDAPVLGAPAALGDTLYLATRAGTVYRIEPGGPPFLRLITELDWPVTAPVTIAGRQILLGGADGIIRALRTDGTEIWRVRVWRPVELGPVALRDGLVALGGNGDLHRFRQ